jgi:glycerol kinase
MKDYIVSIDQGTTGTTVSVINSGGKVCGTHDQDFQQHYPQPGWVEHDLRDIWGTVETCLKMALQKAKVSGHDIAAIGITNQRETVAIWNRKTGKPLHNAIVWQCRRTTDFCNRLKKRGLERSIRNKTGLVVDPYFSASKLRWFLDNVTEARGLAKAGELACGTMDTFVVWNLTAGQAHVTDVSNASRTQLMNIKTGAWDKELLKIFGVPAHILPDIHPSSGVFGHTKGLASLPDGIPISGIAGDQQAALFGQACFQPGDAKCTYGTGSFILMNTGKQLVMSKSGMLTTVAWQIGKQPMVYAVEGGAFVCGAAVQWLRDELGFFANATEIEALAATVADSAGVEFVPALTGLGAPHWNPTARGLICGLTRGVGRAHIARATLDAMALQNVEILEAMQVDSRKRIRELKVDGGASANNLLMQLQADYLGCTITRPSNIETTSMGAALLAGLGVGLWSSTEELKKIAVADKSFIPKLDVKKRRERLKLWSLAVRRASI